MKAKAQNWQEIRRLPGSVLYRALMEDGTRILVKRFMEGSGLEAWERANRESELLRRLSLPCAPVLVDVSEHNLQPCLRLIDPGGELLSNFTQTSISSHEWALTALLCMARSLGQLERAGLTLRSLCPEAVMYNPHTGHVTIVDLEHALHSRRESGAMELAALNMSYTAPEICGGKGRRADTRSDLYSLGVIAFEMLTGRRPFESDDPVKLLHSHLAVVPLPPSTLDPRITPEIDDLVARLLEKEPAARYQSASAVQAQIGRVLCSKFGVESSGRPCSGPLEDKKIDFKSKLYGRSEEVRQLSDCLMRCREGYKQVVVLSGPSGIGKTSLVSALTNPASGREAYFAVGKFEQLRRDTPYAAVIQAVDELLQRLQTLPEQILSAWTTHVKESCGSELGLLTGALPRLGQILNLESCQAQQLKDTALQQTYLRAFTSLIASFASRERPLVLFLDDMQWADPAGSNLLLQLAQSQEIESVLLVLAYRNDEPEVEAPGPRILQLIREACRPLELALRPLSSENVTAMIVDILKQSPESARKLAAQIHSKTEGNPFFVRQFISTLEQEGLLIYDSARNCFEVSEQGLEALAVSSNVADLLLNNLHRLDPRTLQALALAAVVGSTFDSATLALLLEKSEQETSNLLAAAAEGGWILEIGRLFNDQGSSIRYAFAHDKIQETLCGLLKPEELCSAHRQLGRRLLQELSPEQQTDRLFELLGHLNATDPDALDAQERDRVATLNLRAGDRSLASAAFDLATRYYDLAAELTPWVQDHRRAFLANQGIALSHLLCGNPQTALRHADDCLEQSLSPLENAMMEVIALRASVALGKGQEAIERARRGTARLGIRLPVDREEIAELTEQRVSSIMDWLDAGPCDRLLEMTPISDPETLTLLRLLTEVIPPSYMLVPELMALCSAKQLHITLESGLSYDTPRILLNFCVLLSAKGDRQRAIELARTAMKLDGMRSELERDPINLFIMGSFVSAWVEPIAESISRFEECFHSSIDLGCKEHAAWATIQGLLHQLFEGSPLPSAATLATTRIGLTRKFEIGPLIHLQKSGEIACLSLVNGVSWQCHKEQREALEAVRKTGNKSLEGIVQTFRLVSAYLLDDPRQAYALAQESSGVRNWNRGMLCSAVHTFFAQLSFTGCEYHTVDGLATLEEAIAWFEAEAENCPPNFRCKLELLKAEWCRVRGDALAAMKHYDQAIEESKRARCMMVEALASELASEHWQKLGKTDFAMGYLRKARAAYAKWGCTPKVRNLERIYPGAFELVGSGARTANTHNIQYETLIRGTQILSGELELGKLLGLMSETIVQTTGAQKGVIVLDNDQQWEVVSFCLAGESAMTLEPGAPLETSTELPVSLAHYVARTGCQQLLEDATSSHLFGSDPYVVEHQPKSVLCSPILRSSKQIGLIYLENRVYSGAFTSSTSEALGFLASQMAVSIENARLYQTALRQKQEIENTAVRLEEMVKERTRELLQANDMLVAEGKARSRMESELRLAQKLQSVGQLAAGIAHEINTPLQFVGDNLGFLGDAFEDIFPILEDILQDRTDLQSLKESAQEIDLGYLAAEVPEALRNSLSGVSKVSTIVKAMRTTAHPDLGKKSSVDLNQLVRDSLVLTRSEYNMVATLEEDLKPLPCIPAFAGALSQVFINLIVNASHAMEERFQGQVGKGLLRVTTECEGDWVIARISDNGPGIPEDRWEQLFDPFFTTKAVGKGTGQGLAIARSAVERHAGELTFETQVGIGTTFTVRLPKEGVSPVEVEPPVL